MKRGNPKIGQNIGRKIVSRRIAVVGKALCGQKWRLGMGLKNYSSGVSSYVGMNWLLIINNHSRKLKAYIVFESNSSSVLFLLTVFLFPSFCFVGVKRFRVRLRGWIMLQSKPAKLTICSIYFHV